MISYEREKEIHLLQPIMKNDYQNGPKGSMVMNLPGGLSVDSKPARGKYM